MTAPSSSIWSWQPPQTAMLPSWKEVVLCSLGTAATSQVRGRHVDGAKGLPFSKLAVGKGPTCIPAIQQEYELIACAFVLTPVA
jgi:hypothetical protein